MSKMYNPKIKEQFLSKYDNEQTRNTIRHVFYNTELIESVLEKDLYDFSIEEIGKAIENTNPHNKNVARSNGRFITQYISWAIEPPHRLRKNALNPLKGILPDWYDKFVDKSKKVHYSLDEFKELLESLHNAADQSLLCLFWEGIIGKSFSQVRELKFEDIRWDSNEIFVQERNESIKVSDLCIKYLEKTQRENTYYTYNPETKELSEAELLPSPYVFKNLKSPRSVEGQAVNPSVLYKRINLFREELGLEYMTPNSLKQSSMIKMSLDLYQEYGKLDYEQFAKIGDKFQYATVKSSNMEYYNTTLMKEFINPENFKELYDIDVQF